MKTPKRRKVAELKLSPAENAKAWKQWVKRGPQGQIEDESKDAAGVAHLLAHLPQCRRELWQPIAEILMNEWDPIGVRGVPAAIDEYDTYVREVHAMLERGTTVDALQSYLDHVASDWMGSATATLHIRARSRRVCSVGGQRVDACFHFNPARLLKWIAATVVVTPAIHEPVEAW